MRPSNKCLMRDVAGSQVSENPLAIVNELQSTFETTIYDDEPSFPTGLF